MGRLWTGEFSAGDFEQIEKTSEYWARRKKIDAFNSSSRTKLKGMSLDAGEVWDFVYEEVSESGTLVNVYTDGTVQVSTGGTEMVQGLNTKIRQLVS